ncbi:MAG: efflux RND transporter periplasmic adaptor subunit [Lachnospiraceae bacterium]|nr:efflux RND transporter periplasmic adaptor subunit [Lachnospiraceae bacterium]
MGNDSLDMMELDELNQDMRRSTREKRRKRKKRHTGRLILLCLAGAIAAFVGVRTLTAKNHVPTVEAYAVQKGDIRQEVSISGTVVTDEEKSYFAKAAIPVASIPVSVGDTVKKGDVLLTFDNAKVNLAQQTTELSHAAQTGNYENSLQQDAKNRADFAEANTNVPILDEQVDFIKDWIQELQLKISEKKQRMNQTYLELQEARLIEQQNLAERMETTSSTLEELDRLLYESQIRQNNDAEINAWTKQVEDLQQELTKYQEERSKMKSQQTSSEASLMNPGALNALNATQQSNTLTSEDTLSSLEEAAQGITADFDGVVTEIKIREGATPSQGMELIHIASTEKVKVDIQITKTDLDKVRLGQDVTVTVAGREYQGEVSKIAGNATRNSGGMAVVSAKIDILNPDEYLILGVEADTDIHTNDAKEAIILPYQYINSDSEGDFVNAVVDGVITRIPITIGITTDTAVEVSSGLTEGTQVVSTLPAGVEEGSRVETVPAAAQTGSSMDGMMDMMMNSFG